MEDLSVSGVSGVQFRPGCHTMRTITVNTQHHLTPPVSTDPPLGDVEDGDGEDNNDDVGSSLS